MKQILNVKIFYLNIFTSSVLKFLPNHFEESMKQILNIQGVMHLNAEKIGKLLK